MSSTKTNKKILKLMIFCIFCLLLFSKTINAEEYRLVFNHLDAAADDYGPGNYQYPKHHIFQNKGYLFDLKVLTIYESKNNYKFRFSFSKLTDPWGAKFGFSLPLIEIYFDNQQQGSTKLFQSGANVSFDNDFSWNKLLKISGWWLRLFTPESSEKNIFDFDQLVDIHLNSLDNFKLYKEKNDVLLEIPKNKIGKIKAAKIVVLIGSFDPFGFDHFRSLSAEKKYWQIYNPDITNNESINKLPRVLDILVPPYLNQKEILQGELPVIPYLTAAKEFEVPKKNLVDKLMPLNLYFLILVLLYIFLIIIVIYKFKR